MGEDCCFALVFLQLVENISGFFSPDNRPGVAYLVAVYILVVVELARFQSLGSASVKGNQSEKFPLFPNLIGGRKLRN